MTSSTGLDVDIVEKPNDDDSVPFTVDMWAAMVKVLSSASGELLPSR